MFNSYAQRSVGTLLRLFSVLTFFTLVSDHHPGPAIIIAIGLWYLGGYLKYQSAHTVRIKGRC